MLDKQECVCVKIERIHEQNIIKKKHAIPSKFVSPLVKKASRS